MKQIVFSGKCTQRRWMSTESVQTWSIRPSWACDVQMYRWHIMQMKVMSCGVAIMSAVRFFSSSWWCPNLPTRILHSKSMCVFWGWWGWWWGWVKVRVRVRERDWEGGHWWICPLYDWRRSWWWDDMSDDMIIEQIQGYTAKLKVAQEGNELIIMHVYTNI